ncbi:MAG: hypothetical protein FWF26_03945 [Treponema sp.]|nr:hypothetical protein [Treponema sp.]
MSDTGNPYASPQAGSVPAQNLIVQPALTDKMAGFLREASPWMRFIGVMEFIGCGFLALIGIIMMAAMGALTSLWDSIPEFGKLGNTFGAVFSASIGAVYLVMAVFLFFPALFTWNFGAKIRDYFQSGKEQELELAFKNNKSLWKFYGILMIIELALIPVLIIIGIAVAVTASLI